MNSETFTVHAAGVSLFVSCEGSRVVRGERASVAKKLGIPRLIIGLTIVAMGTSMPEAAVSIMAAMQKNVGITIGNIFSMRIKNKKYS